MKIYPKILFAAWVSLAACGRAPDVAGKPVTAAIKRDRPNLAFSPLHPDPQFTGLVSLGKISRDGVGSVEAVLTRALRFSDIAEAVEARYGLPRVLLAMAAQEAGGAELLTNGQDDGGAGIIHMQPATAVEFGLKTYRGCEAMVSHAHGAALRQLIADKRGDVKRLALLDDRFHPIINVDAAGRMLALYMSSAPKGSDPLQHALRRYSGRPEYWANVQRWRKRIDSAKVRADLAARFAEANPDFRVNGVRGGLESYLAEFWRQHENYGLAAYRRLPRYAPLHAAEMRQKWSGRYD